MDVAWVFPAQQLIGFGSFRLHLLQILQLLVGDWDSPNEYCVLGSYTVTRLDAWSTLNIFWLVLGCEGNKQANPMNNTVARHPGRTKYKSSYMHVYDSLWSCGCRPCHRPRKTSRRRISILTQQCLKRICTCFLVQGQPPDAESWLLTTGCYLLLGCWLLAAGCWLLLPLAAAKT